jgi:alginate O-acetyltransferase complex protein AlgJ
MAAEPYKDLAPAFNRIKSNCMVRSIAVATLANLDYAAYNANPVLYEPQKVKPAKPEQAVTLASITFNGLLSDVKDHFSQTPLTDAERQKPMAWRPLTRKLWGVVKEQQLQNIASVINGYKWADPKVYQAYQEIVTAWLHGEGPATEVWVKVEFAPWVSFLSAVDDEDKDGFREIYGKLSLAGVAPDSLAKAFAWIRTDYQTRVVTREQGVDWITELASYWYPTKNTDIIDMTGQDTWPNTQTKKVALKTMKGVTVKNPLAVVEGKPFSPDKPIYNVYVVEQFASSAPAAQVQAAVGPAAAKTLDTACSRNFRENTARFDAEVKQYGDYAAWARKNNAFFTSLRKHMAALPAEQMGFKGQEDWVFFRKSVDYLLAGDLATQPKDKNPLPNLVEFQKYLTSQNISLLFVAVPNKEEIYFDKLPADVTRPAVAYVNPYSRKILKDLQAAGIEVIDLLPVFLKAKEQDVAAKDNVYQHQDTHWTSRGMQAAAELIANRIKEFAWYGETAAERVAYTLVDTTFERLGDIVDKLPEAERPSFPPVVLHAKQVHTPEGKPNPPRNTTAPILLIGDSFTGVFELVDCKSAGLGSHIAAATGLPVDMITSWGGGPLVRQMMLRQRAKDLPYKRVVVYVMVARDLYNYGQGWEPLEPPK